MKKYSRFLSLVLRHAPEKADLTLDKHGWCDVSDVMRALRTHVGPFNREQLNELVETNDKKRFAFNDQGTKIRASQGHSIDIDLALTPSTPPETLYHGTKTDYMESIMATGLSSQKRQHVHLSPNLDTATAVAGRRSGTSVILAIDTRKVEGEFFLSANGVWLTHSVTPDAISVLKYI